MRHNAQEVIDALTEELDQLNIKKNEIDQNIESVKRQLRRLSGVEIIGPCHIGRQCKVLNPHAHQPATGTIVGFTKGARPFVRVQHEGFLEIKRLPKNLELLPEASENSETEAQ